MKIIVSPAKTMRAKAMDCSIPYFIEDAKIIREELRKLDKDALAKLWKCNDKIVNENIELLKRIDIEHDLTRAIYAYDGLQFKNLDIEALDDASIGYLNESLFILSAVYGALRPNDGVVAYRLEMQGRLKINDSRIMYSYWGDRIYNYITRDDNIIINLASKEYSDAITPYLKDGVRIITISFGSIKDGRLLVKSTESKIMRGQFLRYLAINKINSIEGLKGFNYKDMRYSAEYSADDSIVFVC